MSDIGAFALNLIAAYSHMDMLTLTHREILSGFTMCHLFFGKILPASGESQLRNNLHISALNYLVVSQWNAVLRY